jgi:hypothetical protein
MVDDEFGDIFNSQTRDQKVIIASPDLKQRHRISLSQYITEEFKA